MVSMSSVSEFEWYRFSKVSAFKQINVVMVNWQAINTRFDPSSRTYCFEINLTTTTCKLMIGNQWYLLDFEGRLMLHLYLTIET